ncbi:hypothetical protein [Psittacicella gerlachiana]|uniref:UvrABC system protein A n=1 Tax=Psittacicella gerlachiana TaxID=2028574 RepID=A0A3A1YIV6_9GAMM|nr:hypothetical protein [Psittacicella gerlachiana]RIY36174.1 hypothetical protein CKF59_02960 [Psittacicella gerlachiana]
MEKFIRIQNAYLHNLQIPELTIPLNKFVVITGSSGSGKTTLIRDILVAQSQMMLNLNHANNIFNFSQYYKQNKILKVNGLTPIQYLSQRIPHNNKRANINQFLGIEAPINVLFSQYASFSEQVDKAFTKSDIKKIITSLPTPAPEILQNATKRGGLGYRYRFHVTTPIHLALIPGLENLDFPASTSLTPAEITQRNKTIFKAIRTNFPVEPDTIIVNKSIVLDFFDLEEELEDLDYSINSIDISFYQFKDSQQLDDSFNLEFDKEYDRAVKDEEDFFQEFFNKHAGINTDLNKLGLTSQDSFNYSSTNQVALRVIYPPQIGIYSPITQEITSYSLQNLVSTGSSQQIFDLSSQNSFSTFGKNKCPDCKGSGLKTQEEDSLEEYCSLCAGTGLSTFLTQAKINNYAYADLFNDPLHKVYDFFLTYLKQEELKIPSSQDYILSNSVDNQTFKVALIHEVLKQIEHLIDLNLGYLSLVRKVHTLSGGEIQRIQLSKILSNQTTGVTYILDEPSIGLHPIDNQKLINKLKLVVARGNSVIVVEHDRDFILHANEIIDLSNGKILFTGTKENLLKTSLPLVNYLNYKTPISQIFAEINNNFYNQQLEKIKTLIDQDSLKSILVNTDYTSSTVPDLNKITEYAKNLKINLKNLFSLEHRRQRIKNKTKILYDQVSVGYFKQEKVTFIRNALNVITGVSGSGKSIFASRILYAATSASLKLKSSSLKGSSLPKEFKKKYKLEKILGIGLEQGAKLKKFSRVLFTKQSLAKKDLDKEIISYIGINENLAQIFADSSQINMRNQLGTGKGKFITLEPQDFLIKKNNRPNKCSECQGRKYLNIEIDKGVNEKVTCFECNGSGFAPYVLSQYLAYDKNSSVKYNIADFHKLTVDQAYDFLVKYHKNYPSTCLKDIIIRLAYLKRFRLGHLTLGRQVNEISGGEIQRLYLITEISHSKLSRTPQDQECLIIIDEPSTGLHFDDIQSLLDFLIELKDQGHTIIVIEHNIDLIYNCDYLVEFGPGAAEKGGKVVFSGYIDEILENKTKNQTHIMQEISKYHHNMQQLLQESYSF